MKKLSAVMVLLVFLASAETMGNPSKTEEPNWVKPGNTVFEFPATTKSFSTNYKTVIFYSDYYKAENKAVLEKRIVKVGGTFSEDAPVCPTVPIDLNLRIGNDILVGDTINDKNNPIHIKVLNRQTDGWIRLKIY